MEQLTILVNSIDTEVVSDQTSAVAWLLSDEVHCTKRGPKQKPLDEYIKNSKAFIAENEQYKKCNKLTTKEK